MCTALKKKKNPVFFDNYINTVVSTNIICGLEYQHSSYQNENTF